MPAAGWSDFWNVLSQKFDVRLSSSIQKIERSEKDSLLHFKDGTQLAAGALACTIPMDDWASLVNNPTPDETAVAGAITWTGYATSLIVVENWFTSEDIRSFSKAFLPGSYPGQLISARYEGHSPDFGGHLYVTGQIPGDYTLPELRIFLQRDLADLGANLINVVNAKTWRYFPHYDLKAISAGLLGTMRGMQGREAGEEAFEELLDFVREKNQAAAECLEKRREGILAFHGLNVPSTLNVTFLSTNNIENVMRNTRGTIGRVCRWNPKTDQLSRWMGVALLRAQEGFRRIRGHKEMGALAAALGRSGSAASSLRSSSAAPARPSAGGNSELAVQQPFSYRMSISQPAEILTI
jgi:hypothetical protein